MGGVGGASHGLLSLLALSAAARCWCSQAYSSSAVYAGNAAAWRMLTGPQSVNRPSPLPLMGWKWAAPPSPRHRLLLLEGHARAACAGCACRAEQIVCTVVGRGGL